MTSNKKQTFYQQAAKSLNSKGYVAKHSAVPGMFTHPEKDAAVVLKNRGNLERFRGYPKAVSALLLVDDQVYSLCPKDFYQL